LRVCDDGGKNNSVWLERPEGVKHYFFHRINCCPGTQSPYARQQKNYCLAVPNATKLYNKNNSLKNLKSLSHL